MGERRLRLLALDRPTPANHFLPSDFIEEKARFL
jgi:hypothetical protein